MRSLAALESSESPALHQQTGFSAARGVCHQMRTLLHEIKQGANRPGVIAPVNSSTMPRLCCKAIKEPNQFQLPYFSYLIIERDT
jgi:hypothetical protein